MKSPISRSALVLLLGSLHMGAAIANPFEGVQEKTYCLRDICIGDPLSSHPQVQNVLAAGGRLTENPCKVNPLGYTGQFEADGVQWEIGVMNDPGRQGKPVGEYYRISSVQANLKTPLTIDQYNALGQQLIQRMGLSREGMRDIQSSYQGLGPRKIILQRWKEATKLYLYAINFDPTEIRAYEDAPGCKRATAPDL